MFEGPTRYYNGLSIKDVRSQEVKPVRTRGEGPILRGVLYGPPLMTSLQQTDSVTAQIFYF